MSVVKELIRISCQILNSMATCIKLKHIMKSLSWRGMECLFTNLFPEPLY